ILESLGSLIAYLFVPLGFGSWQAAVATILGLLAKEEVVGVFGSLTSMGNADLALGLVEEGNSQALTIIGQEIFGGNKLSGLSFLIFNLLCAPCFAAMGAIKREMNDWRWTVGAIAYMSVFAYAISLIVYQLGSWFTGGGNIIGTVAALIVLGLLIYLLVRKNKYDNNKLTVK
ncbi:MAG: ferrous iron transporter B, partial [Oscillospiraceae bacterium]|nr:ferrous iron transporter B [Oscillospiraceae bacterium]